MRSEFPRILLIVRMPVNDRDSTGTIRNLLMEWPKDRLAQIYSTDIAVSQPFCSRQYKLGENDRLWGSLFMLIKKSNLGLAVRPVPRFHAISSGDRQHYQSVKYQMRVSRYLRDLGIWELLFKPMISDQLESWIRSFNPDMIYFPGSDLSYMRLCLEIHNRFQLPICLHFVDDWVEKLYASSPLASLMRLIIQREFFRLVRTSSSRFALGKRWQRNTCPGMASSSNQS